LMMSQVPNFIGFFLQAPILLIKEVANYMGDNV
jgi:hypothetical protein